MNILRNDTIDSSMMPHQMDEDFEVARQLQLLEWEDLNNKSTKLAPPFPTTLMKQESVTPNKRRPANKQLHRNLSHLQQSLQDLLLDSSSDMKREPTMLVVKQPSCRLMNNSLSSLQSSTTTIPHFTEWTEDANAVYEAYNDYDDNSMLTVPHPGPATGRDYDNGILGLVIIVDLNSVDTQSCCSELTGHKETGGATRPGAVAVTTTAMAIHTITPTKPSIHPRRARVLEEIVHQEEKLVNGGIKQPKISTPLEKNDGISGGHRATATAFCHVQTPSPILDAVCVPVMTPSSAIILSPTEVDDDDDETPMAGDNNNDVIWC